MYEFHAVITYYASNTPFQVTLVKNSEVLATLQDATVLESGFGFSRYKSIIVACVVDDVVFAYSDVANQTVMIIALMVLAAGANFRLSGFAARTPRYGV